MAPFGTAIDRPGVTLPAGWMETDGDTADYLLEVLPPIWLTRGFMCSEAIRHDDTGAPVYQAVTDHGDRWYTVECTVSAWPAQRAALLAALAPAPAVAGGES